MKTADLLALADREAATLAHANNHAAAAIVRELAERVRLYADKLRAAGVKEPEAKAA